VLPRKCCEATKEEVKNKTRKKDKADEREGRKEGNRFNIRQSQYETNFRERQS
jgi:hypothetical protein